MESIPDGVNNRLDIKENIIELKALEAVQNETEKNFW